MIEQCKAKNAVQHDNDDDASGDPVDEPIFLHSFSIGQPGSCFCDMFHSVRRLSDGLARAALMDWKLMVSRVINRMAAAAARNIPALRGVR